VNVKLEKGTQFLAFVQLFCHILDIEEVIMDVVITIVATMTTSHMRGSYACIVVDVIGVVKQNHYHQNYAKI
jgi:hypothetical protein